MGIAITGRGSKRTGPGKIGQLTLPGQNATVQDHEEHFFKPPDLPVDDKKIGTVIGNIADAGTNGYLLLAQTQDRNDQLDYTDPRNLVLFRVNKNDLKVTMDEKKLTSYDKDKQYYYAGRP